MTARSSNAPDGVGASLSESARAAMVAAKLANLSNGQRSAAPIGALTQDAAADMAQPGELAALLAYLHGELLHGACKLIEKALRGRHA